MLTTIVTSLRDWRGLPDTKQDLSSLAGDHGKMALTPMAQQLNANRLAPAKGSCEPLGD